MSNPPTDAAVSTSTSRAANALGIDLVQGALFILISAMYAVLMFTDRVPLWGMLALLALWGTHAVLSQRWTLPTPLDIPLVALLALLPLSLAISVDWSLSLPKVYGVVLGIALFYLIVNAVRDYQRLRLAILGLVLLGVGTALLGLVSANWTATKVLEIPQVYARLPRLADSIAGLQGGINPNTFGGALTFFIPLLSALLLDGGAFQRVYLANKRHPQWVHIAYKLFLLAALALSGPILLLTQSRGAYLGTAAGMLALAIWKDRRFLLLLPILLVVFVLILQGFGAGSFSELLSRIDTTRDPSLRYRLESWEGTMAMIQDFPFTGAGIGAYGALYSELYAYNIFSDSTAPFAAHNTLLSVAVDLGLPALVLYTAILSSFVSMIKRPIKTGRSIIRTLLMGLACGLLAHQVFGIMDAFVLGTKLGIIQWIFLGLAAAIFTHQRNFHWRSPLTADPQTNLTRQKALRHLGDLAIGLVLWLLLSLAAITFINLSPYLSLGLAVTGGLLLGVFLTKRYNHESSKLKGRRTGDRRPESSATLT